MPALYVVSMEARGGSTALCAGIGANLLSRTKKVGFLIPVRLSSDAKTTSDPLLDAFLLKEVFQLPEQAEQICPFVVSPGELWQYLTDELSDFGERLKQAYLTISQNRDVVIMEGLGNLGKDKLSELACYTIPEILQAKVIIILPYSTQPDVTKLLQTAKKLGTRLLGVVINLTPASRLEKTKQYFSSQFEQSGIRVLAVLPQVRTLCGMTVAELSEAVDGELISNGNASNEIVENIMLGAMTSGSGIDYFSRKNNKAVIVKADRPDMQLAALQTSTKCLILTNAVRQPIQSVMAVAQEKHVPIITTKRTVPQVISDIEKALAKVSLAHPEKVQKFSSTLGTHFDFKTLYAGLGLDTK